MAAFRSMDKELVCPICGGPLQVHVEAEVELDIFATALRVHALQVEWSGSCAHHPATQRALCDTPRVHEKPFALGEKP